MEYTQNVVARWGERVKVRNRREAAAKAKAERYGAKAYTEVTLPTARVIFDATDAYLARGR